MKPKANPWIDRYSALDNLERIKKLSQVKAVALDALESNSPGVAADRILKAFQAIFYPSQRSCEIIQEVVQAALAHATAYYPDGKAVLGRSYLEVLDIEPYVPILLTGLAGTGKTQIRKAIGRLLGEGKPDGKVVVDAKHSPFPLAAVRSVIARARNSISALLRPIAPPEVASGDERMDLAELPDACGRYQYFCGVCLLLIDELQFMTQSQQANTLIAQAMLALSYVRLPHLVVANFSLGHRLSRRPSEELQRLLGHVIVLLPDPMDSEDWRGLLREYQCAVPGAYDFSFVDQAIPLWKLCAGIKRELARLLVLAYKLARASKRNAVSWDDVEQAYVSVDFSVSRKDIEALILHGVTSKSLREDLRCPFEISASVAAGYANDLKTTRNARVSAAAVDASMTEAERQAKAVIGKAMGVAPAPKSAKKARASTTTRTADSLKDAGQRFRQRTVRGKGQK